ncbi:MAG: hypothetical protein U1E39_13530 [Planctomycetota bacterium]
MSRQRSVGVRSARPRAVAGLVVSLGVALAGLATPARAAEDAPVAPVAGAPVELPLVAGSTLKGVVESTDANEVVLLVGPGARRRVPWVQLAPLGVFRVKAALTKPDDGPGRLALAALAGDLGLFAEARAEYEKALALGAIEGKAYQDAVADAERRAVDAGIARAERAADAGDVATALEVLRGLQLDFAHALDPKRAAALLATLEARIAARDADQRKAKDDADRLALDVDRRREIVTRMTEAKKQLGLGDRHADEAREIMPRGNVTKVGKAAEAADDAYGAARRELGRLRRIVRKDESERDAVLALLADLDKRQFRLLFDAAKFYWSARVFARADEWATRASYLDPVDPSLMELRDEIRSHRIRYRFSDVTNARPR